MSWIEDKPERTDLVRDFGPLIRSHKTEFRAAVEKHFFWTESSGLSAGEPNHQVGGGVIGSCRAFFGTESQVSAFRDGSLMVTSDTSRLYGLTSDSSVLLGSSRAVYIPPPAVDDNRRVLVQSAQANTTYADGTFNIAFPTEFDLAPTRLTIQPRVLADNNQAHAVISNVTRGGFEFKVERAVADVELWWRAVGIVAV